VRYLLSQRIELQEDSLRNQRAGQWYIIIAAAARMQVTMSHVHKRQQEKKRRTAMSLILSYVARWKRRKQRAAYEAARGVVGDMLAQRQAKIDYQTDQANRHHAAATISLFLMDLNALRAHKFVMAFRKLHDRVCRMQRAWRTFALTHFWRFTTLRLQFQNMSRKIEDEQRKKLDRIMKKLMQSPGLSVKINRFRRNKGYYHLTFTCHPNCNNCSTESDMN
jgi:hypothetical protein